MIYIKQKVIFSNVSEKNKVKLLAIICPVVDKFENKRSTIAYNYYFLGCFYYKINDYLTAVDCLKQCKILNRNREIRKSASELLDNIWNTKIKPSILRWWLYSPSNCWFKRISFLVLSFSLFCFIPELFRFFNFFYCSYISYTENSLFFFNFEFVSFYITFTVQNGILDSFESAKSFQDTTYF